jgi:hypothetical protein
VLVVALFRGQHFHVERGSGGQKQRVSALGVVDGGSEIGTGTNPNRFSRRRCAVERGVVTGFGEFSDPVLFAKLRDISRAAIGIFTGRRRTGQRGSGYESEGQ